jgi:hypothetical protein
MSATAKKSVPKKKQPKPEPVDAPAARPPVNVRLPEYLVAQCPTVGFQPHDELGWVWWPDDSEEYHFTARCARCHGVSFVMGVAPAHCPYCGAGVDSEKTEHRSCKIEMIELMD